jgi:hypothetical protein
MTVLVPFNHGLVAPRTLDADRLIERWREGRSPQTLRAYSNDPFGANRFRRMAFALH